MLWNDGERSHPTSIASGCGTYEEEPNIILIVDKGFTKISFAQYPRLIRSIRFWSATEATSLVVDDLVSL